jgi:hypothetical protein
MPRNLVLHKKNMGLSCTKKHMGWHLVMLAAL